MYIRTVPTALITNSHVKCDELINVKPDNIIMKLGTVTIEQYDRFMALYEKSLEKHSK